MTEQVKYQKEIEYQPKNTANTSSTLIDADLSFDSFIEANSNNTLQVEEDEDSEQLSIRLDDLSIATMLTNHSNMTESYRCNQILNDDDFDRDLKKLDQKISDVKQILLSMK